jgi:hypothetical protein
MDARARLSKIKLRTTPRRIAIEFIESVHSAGSYDEMATALHRVQEMETEIKNQLGSSPKTNSFVRRARRQTFLLAGLYCYAAHRLLLAVNSTAELVGLTSGYTNFESSPCPELFDRLTDEYNQLSIRIAEIDYIQQRYLNSRVLPEFFSKVISGQLLNCEWQRELVAAPSSRKATGLLPPEACTEQAETNVRTYGRDFYHHGDYHSTTYLGKAVRAAVGDMAQRLPFLLRFEKLLLDRDFERRKQKRSRRGR